MSDSAKQLLEDALRLSESERASVAGALIESLHGPAEADVVAAWDVEIERRVGELDAKRVKTVPGPEARSALFDGFE